MLAQPSPAPRLAFPLLERNASRKRSNIPLCPIQRLMDEPGQFYRQGSVPLCKTNLRKQGSLRRTKSFRVTFSPHISVQDVSEPPQELIKTSAKSSHNQKESMPPPQPQPPKQGASTSSRKHKEKEKESASSHKIALRRKPARRPTSHVPKGAVSVPLDSEDEVSQDDSRRSSIAEKIDSVLLSPMEHRLRQLALKYRNATQERKSKIPVPISRPARGNVTSITSRFESYNSNV